MLHCLCITYETLTASSLAEAKSVVASDAEFDILFTDLNLFEDKDAGIEVGNLVVQSRPGTPILYTGGRQMTDALKLRMVDGSGFLEKPYTDDHVTAALATLLTK